MALTTALKEFLSWKIMALSCQFAEKALRSHCFLVVHDLSTTYLSVLSQFQNHSASSVTPFFSLSFLSFKKGLQAILKSVISS